MKKWILAIVIVGMLGLVVYEYVLAPSAGSTVEKYDADTGKVGNRKGDIAFDFELTTLEGETVKLSDFKGERIMLNFWATWCPPCRAEMPDMQKFQANHDVKVLAVNLTDTESDPANVQKFIDEYGLTFTIPLDKESEVASLYQIVAYPTTFMIDSNGLIQFVMMGAMNYDMMVQQFEMLE
jgi:peroxiredoxin